MSAKGNETLLVNVISFLYFFLLLMIYGKALMRLEKKPMAQRRESRTL